MKVQNPTGNQLFKPGLYWNPARTGWGINLTQVTQNDGVIVAVAVIYTYREDGTPIWYLASAPMSGTHWNATLQEFFWNGSSAVPTNVGTIQLDFDSFNSALMSYTINGDNGSETIVFFEFDEPPTSNELTALWFPPSEPGRGLTVSTIGSSSAAVLYYYDENGAPLWLIGSIANAINLGEETNMPVDRVTGYCLACPTVNTRATPAGALRLTFNSRRNARLVSDNISAWQADIEIVPLSDVTEKDQGTQPPDQARIQPLLSVLPVISDDVTGQLSGQATAILTTALSPGSSNGPIVTTTPAALDFNNLPEILAINIDYGDNFISEEGKSIMGIVDITLSDLVFDDTKIGSDFDFQVQNLLSDNVLVGDGNISGKLELTSGQSSGFDGILNLKFADFKTADNMISGELKNVFKGLEFSLDGSTETRGTITTTLNNLSVDGDLVSGTTTTVLLPAKTDFSGNLNTLNGVIKIELSIEKFPDGSSLLNTTGPSSINGESFTIDQLRVTSDRCDGNVVFENGERYTFNGDCENPVSTSGSITSPMLPETTVFSLAGFWDSEFGCVDAEQTGNSVAADIFYFNGNKGSMTGTINNGVYTYQWSNNTDNGTGVLTAGENVWSGFFIDSRTGQKGDWNLTKQSAPC
ncbi:MAG TPA: hypothetical protein ENJ32_07470 [Crenotrichaceae bacterium]|nr:hypothetical protein [Crenotrichaceae bacterium]